MVHTEEFTLNRLGGDSAAAERVYDGVERPLVGDGCRRRHRLRAERAGARQPRPVTMRPVAQSAQHLLARGPLRVRGGV